MWNNKLTVNTGQRADKTVRDHAAEDSLSAAEASNITVYKKPPDTQISRALRNWSTNLIDSFHNERSLK